MGGALKPRGICSLTTGGVVITGADRLGGALVTAR